MSFSERPKPSLLDRLDHLTEKPKYDVKKQSNCQNQQNEDVSSV